MQVKAVDFQKGNVEDLRKKLSKLLDYQEDVKKYKETAQEYICRKYNWDDVVEKTVGLYNK